MRFCACIRLVIAETGISLLGLGATSRADAEPLDDEKLDCEGRCLLTEHEGFVMLNVYVPASGSGRERLPHKHRFLRALKSRVKAEQERGNTPVVVGDFNIAYRPKDVHWRHRLVKLGLLEQHGDPPGGISAELHAKLKRMIGDVRRLLASMEVVHIPAKGSSKSSSSSVVGIYGQRSMDSYVARIKTDCGESVAIGKKFQSNDEAEMRLRLQRVVQADPDTREEFTAWPEDRLSIEHLAEVLKAMGTPLSEDSQRELADSLGETYGAPADVEWMHEFMAECCLHDAFADSHPGAVERFTAWDQYTNKRYENIGCRIDFTFVHSSLMPYIESGESLCGSCKARPPNFFFFDFSLECVSLSFSAELPPFAPERSEQRRGCAHGRCGQAGIWLAISTSTEGRRGNF